MQSDGWLRWLRYCIFSGGSFLGGSGEAVALEVVFEVDLVFSGEASLEWVFAR